MRRPPFLGWVPLATVPQRQRYYGGATTPDTASLGLIGSPSGTMWACAVRGVAPRAPDAPQVRASGRGLVTMPVAPPTGSLPHGRCRVSQVSWRAIPWLCLRSSTPDDPWRLAVGGASGAAPTLTTMKASSLRISRLISGALPPAVYASRRALPRAMQHSLPADGLRLCRTGVEPAGSQCKVSANRILLPRAYPGAI